MMTQGAPHSQVVDRSTAVTRSLLGWGIVAGPLHLAVGIAQAVLRPGFSFARHPLSVLANGDLGWIQAANFALSGLMVMAAAAGVSRATGRGGRATAWAVGTYGLAVLLAAVFRADPMDGFPPGTPPGPPTSISTMGLLHFAVGAIAFTSFGVSALLAARMLRRRGEQGIARVSLGCGLVMLVGFFGGFALPSPVAGIWISVVTGWAWLAALSRHLYGVSSRTGDRVTG